MRNIKLVIAYDGSRYKGWQRLKGAATIQGKLEDTLSRLLGEPIEVIGSGRTDAGVHALGQVANFHCNSTMCCQEILSGLRRYLPEDIGICTCQEAAPRFHARYNARSKTYLYRVWTSPAPCVFLRNQVYRLETELDLETMEKGARQLLGAHDFKTFSSLKKFNKSTVRTLESIAITRAGPELQFRLKADGFLYNMVRILVGTLLEIGQADHALTPRDIPGIFEGTRALAGYTVPAHGLYLEQVEYE